MARPNRKFVEHLVDTLTAPILDVLKIEDEVEIYVVGRNSKEFKAYKITGVCGLTVSHNNKHKVYIVWQNATSHKDAVGTLVHELLHVRLHKFRLPHNREEELVRQLEDLVLLFYNNE